MNKVEFDCFKLKRGDYFILKDNGINIICCTIIVKPHNKIWYRQHKPKVIKSCGIKFINWGSPEFYTLKIIDKDEVSAWLL